MGNWQKQFDTNKQLKEENMNTPEWISKPRHLSVRNLKMWGDNPRLDPSQTYVTLQNFAEGICDAALGDEDAFVELVDSIAKDGFVPIDPIVVWKNPSDTIHS